MAVSATLPTLTTEVFFTATPFDTTLRFNDTSTGKFNVGTFGPATQSGLLLHLNDSTRGKFNTGIFGSASDAVNVIDYVRSFTITRGVSRFDGVYARAEAGKCSLVLDNRDRRFDPTNLSGPYVAAGVTQVVPMRAFRVRATWSGVTYDLWRGFADAWKLSYPNMGKDAISVLTGTDGTKVLANHDPLAGSSVGANEKTGTRIGRILDNAGWASADRDIDTGKTSCQATVLSQNSWSEVLLTSDTEIGEVLFTAEGKLSFRDRHAVLTDSRSANSQATFGDSGSELKYSDIELEHDDTQIYNDIQIARTGGSVQSVSDSASQTKFLKRTFQRSDLIHTTDAESTDYANYVLALFKDGDLRVSSITLKPQRDPNNLYPQALGRLIGDKITVKLTPPGGGTRISREVYIRGIEHRGSPQDWETRFILQDATRFGMFVFNDADQGVIGTNWIGY